MKKNILHIIAITALLLAFSGTLFAQVTDVDGNTYNAVSIGTQVWMGGNLRTTKFKDGSAIANVPVNASWEALSTAAYCWYNNDAATYKNSYGALYNWFAVNTDNLCPSGWHVPTSDEWATLTTFLGGTFIAGSKLKEAGTAHWNSPNTDATNVTGFTALPGGDRTVTGTFGAIGDNGYWWMSTETVPITLGMAKSWTLINTGGIMNWINADKSIGMSVRCINDFLLAILTTTTPATITLNSAQSGGNITSDNGSAVTARGVCWNTSPNPTISNNRTSNSSGTGSFTSTLSGLSPNTTYFVRAYAINTAGTSYGNEISFATLPCPIITASLSGTTTVCSNTASPNMTFTGAGGTSPYTFIYKINNGGNLTVTAPGNSVNVAVPTGTPGTFTYTLVSVYDVNGPICSQVQSGSATVTVNTLPTASIGGTTEACVGGTSPNVTFLGASGTAPYTFTYRINTGPNQIISTTGGNSVNLPVPTGTAGVFTYTLISVSDANACSQSQSGSAAITVKPLPTANISYAGSPWCNTAGVQSVTLTGTTGGTYSASPAGLSIDPGTGAITPGTSTAQNYIVTYSISAGACGIVTATAPVTITALPVATFSYSGSPFCSTAADPLPVFTGGGAAGTFSSDAGLVFLNTATGQIDLSASTSGPHIIINTIQSAGGCGIVISTNNITITEQPEIAFQYPAGPLCNTGPVIHPTIVAGTPPGGTYSATPEGMTINSETGDITLSSTIPGTYAVTYTIPAAGGCGVASGTTIIIISGVPIPSISYTGSPWCRTAGIQNVTLTGGGTGGNYTSEPAGLSLNAASGDINPGLSAPGNYTITYNLVLIGCGLFTANTSVTIIADNTITLSSANNYQTLCLNSSITNIGYTTTEATGATFIGLPAGVSGSWAANSVTISGTPTVSGLFNYIVTLTGGCGVVTASGTITVTAQPTSPIIGTITQPTCVFATGSVILNGLPAGNWTINPGSIAGTGPSFTIPNLTAGNYNYSVTSAGGCTSPASDNVVISPQPPTSTATASNNGPLLVGSLLNLTGGPDGMTTYAWIGPNSFSSALQSPTVSANATIAMDGVYTLTVTNSYGCQSTSTTTVKINSLTVNNVNDAGAGSLREAINYANTTIGIKETITFNIPGAGPFTIRPLTELPQITDPVVINGFSEPGASASNLTIMIELSGTDLSSDGIGLRIYADNCIIQGLAINRFKTGEIELSSGLSPFNPHLSINNTISGNFIGTDVTGTSIFPSNMAGIGIMVGGNNNKIGGSTSSERNIVCGNVHGIMITGKGNSVLGNYVGTDISGKLKLMNYGTGILINWSSDNTIGGSGPGERNVISGNNQSGINIQNSTSTGNKIVGNYIGVDFTGQLHLGNGGSGIQILTEASDNVVGGSNPGEGNVISNNSNEGILIKFSSNDNIPKATQRNKIQGNYIGTNANGTESHGNGKNGIRLDEYAINNLIGGTKIGEGNIIAFNTNSGILCGGITNPSSGNNILSNSIYSNGSLGIDLGDNGVTPDDVGDTDTGANNLQNFPVIDSLNYTSSSFYVNGHLSSQASSSYNLQFFANKVADNSGYGEGRTYLGSKTVTTNSSGTVSFSETFPRSTGWGDVLTSTATDVAGNTSEFSMAVGGLSDQIIAAADWPFHFRVNNEGVPRITDGSDITAVSQSYATWENITTAKIDFVDDGTTQQKTASATDHINLVSFVDNTFPFPPRVLAIAAKTLQISPTDDVAHIIDADILVNPEFVAHDVGVGYGTANSGFYDAQSIITHEIGHVLGLLHTGVVNSTMFFTLNTGTKVRSLEQDDRSWASYKYPGTSYNTTFGSISGHVIYGYGGDPVAGALIMAIRTNVATPDSIHTYSDADGNYLVPGLPAGTYNIYIQPLDGSVNGYNLRPGNISTYIYCNTIYTDYPGEYLSVNESSTEASDVPVSISVSAGSNTPAADIITNRDITPPTFVSVRPTDPVDNKIKVLSNFIIKFSEPIDETTLTNQTCYLELALTTGNKQFGGTFTTLPDSVNIIIFNPDSVLRFNKTYTLHLTNGIKDLRANALIEPSPVSFTTVEKDLVPPTITSTFPVNNADTVFVTAKINVIFSEPMNSESVKDNFALTFTGGNPAVTTKVDGSITWDTEIKTLTFTPSQSLNESTIYTITVSGGATDLSNNHLAARSFVFTTVTQAAPQVIYLGPKNLQTEVTVETPVVADFSEPIDPSTITTSTFSLKAPNSQTAVNGSFEFLNGNSRVVFRPTSILDYGKVYTISLTTGIKDVSPIVRTLTGNITSTFTSATAPVSPTITYLDPPRGKPGYAVTISGTGFDPALSKNLISFNGTVAYVRTATLSTLTTEVPIGTLSGPVTVTVNSRVSNQMQFDIIPDYLNNPDYTVANKSLPSGSSGGVDISGSGEAVFAMVTNPEQNSVTRIGLGSQGGTTTTIQVGGQYPVKVDIDQLGKYAYVTNFNSHDVSVINLTTNPIKVSKIIPVGVEPYGVAVTSDGKRVYISNYNSGNLSLIDVDPKSGGFDHVVANVPTGSNSGSIAVTADAGMVLVTGPFGLKIVDSDPKSVDYNSVIATVSSGTPTTSVTVTADAGFAIVATLEGSLLIVNLHPENDDYSGAVVASVPSGTTVSDVKASGDAIYVYATDIENDQILVYKFSRGGTGSSSGSGAQGITLIPQTPIKNIYAPRGLAVSSSGDKIYTLSSVSPSPGSLRQVTTLSLTGLLISPKSSIESLIATVMNMINNGSITKLRGEALIITLNSALRNVTAERLKLAILDLTAFNALVKTYIKNKQVSTTQGNALIDAANAIIKQLQGTKSDDEEFYTADAETPIGQDLITETKLGMIYPNPSKEAITINYEIAENEKGSEKVTIRVYDVIGRLVGNLVNQDQTPGRYTAIWNGYSDNGELASRGFYFVRFSAGNVREVKQIMLIR